MNTAMLIIVLGLSQQCSRVALLKNTHITNAVPHYFNQLSRPCLEVRTYFEP
jgi:hypothetical protein